MNATLATFARLTRDPAAADGALLDAFLAGDQSAFAALVRRHAGTVFAACRRVLRHQQDAEDAFQATFLVLARRARDVWPREAVGSWLFGVAHRVALKARAVRAKRLGREQPLDDQPGAAPPAPDFDLAEAVQRVVAKLPDVYRAAVVACDLQGLSRKDAAARLGWTEGTLSGRLARARGLLAVRLRRLGFSLPAGGLAAVCATPEVASAQFIQSTITLAIGSAAVGVSAPVAALTHGVVQSMALVKLKAVAAVVVAACALGFGAYTASGSGGDSGDGRQGQTQGSAGQPKPVPKPADPAKPLPQVDLTQQEFDALRRELDAARAKLDAEAAARLQARLEAIERLLNEKDRVTVEKKPSATDELQGSWRIVAITQGGKAQVTDASEPWVIEVRGGTLTLPYKSATGEWKGREYKFGVDATKTPKEIDLIAPNEVVGRGIYEFVAPAAACAKCHQDPFGGAGGKDMTPCPPGLKALLAQPSKAIQLRLAIGDTKRPTKFGFDAGGIVFELTRADARPTDEEAKLKAEHLRIATLLRDARDPADQKKLEAELARIRELIARNENERGKLSGVDPLKKLQNELDARVWEFADPAARQKIKEATHDVQLAQAALQHAQVNAEVARAQVEVATLGLKEAQAKLAAAEKALADLRKPPAAPAAKGGATFTVHVRTLNAAEKVVTAKATGNDTVLDALVHAGDMGLKPDAVSVWVVRDGTILPVDLGGITKNGETKTNYVLKSGDQLFVQVKAK